jgi:DNA-directed RNA polymerase I subunit RPA12
MHLTSSYSPASWLNRLLPDTGSTKVVSRSKPSDFPSPLRQKLSSVQTVERHKIQTEAVDHNVQCDKCDKRGVKWSAQQQRGADEGSTIYYTCINCGNKFVISFSV